MSYAVVFAQIIHNTWPNKNITRGGFLRLLTFIYTDISLKLSKTWKFCLWLNPFYVYSKTYYYVSFIAMCEHFPYHASLPSSSNTVTAGIARQAVLLPVTLNPLARIHGNPYKLAVSLWNSKLCSCSDAWDWSLCWMIKDSYLIRHYTIHMLTHWEDIINYACCTCI